MNKFVHLHLHTHYSLLDGLGKIPEIVSRAKQLGMESLAITDHGVMYGVIEFYQECQKQGIKPIIGVETYVAPREMTSKVPRIDANPYHLVLLAKNEIGYQNLLKLVSLSHLEGFYYKPRVDKELLKKYSKGLIASSACLAGEIPQSAISGGAQAAEKVLLEYLEIFGKDNFFLELQHNPELPDQIKANKIIIELSKKHKVGLIATNDVHYINKDDAEAQDVLLCVQTGKFVSDTDRMSMKENGKFLDISFLSQDEMAKNFADVPEAIENTNKIADMCNLKIEFGRFIFPQFVIKDGKTPEEKLREICYENLESKYPKAGPEVKERLDFELKTIEKMGFANYMLVVADYTNFARSQGISTNTRGSAAGSIVSFLTDITDIEPLRYGLLFERFLNPERISWPDVDLDISDRRREDLIAYVTEKYGADKVAQIITFGTIAAKNGIRDTGRVLSMGYADVDKIAKLIPAGLTLSESLEVVPELKEQYENDSQIKKLFDLAKKIEGVARHASVHAAGVIITDKALTEYVPLQISMKSEQSIVAQYEMHALEDLGLVKMDFLGLANLTIIDDTLRIIRKTKEIDLDINHLPLDDPKTYKLLSAAKTSGVFQLESDGMKRYLKELKPDNIKDVMAMTALYRPGPMELIPEYIAGKHGRKTITYIHPKLEPILAETYGVAVYQEQILQIAREICGFSLGQADVLRKAIGKKIKKLLLEQKEKWVEGAIKNGTTKKIAEKLFEFVEPFARYGFNKAHAASYGLLAYKTAYLKAHFPSEFMAAWMTSEEGRDIEKITFALNEAQNMGIKVLPPNVNESFVDFGVIPSTGDISYALASIKNVGRGATEAIVEERKQNGRYENLEDFLKRLGNKVLNKKILENLAKTGALDQLGERNEILINMENILKFLSDISKDANTNQMGLFGDSKAKEIIQTLKLLPSEPADKKEKLFWEKELLGMYVSEHPLKGMEKTLKNIARPINQITVSEGKTVKVAGIITTISKITTRSNEPMIFATLEDTSAKTEVLVFPKILKKDSLIWRTNNVVLVEGRTNTKDGALKIIAQNVSEITLTPDIKPENQLTITLPKDAKKELLMQIKNILENFPGEMSVVLCVPKNGDFKEVKTKTKIEKSQELIKQLEELLGEGSVE
ncbi:MAG: DNA polymerase III subunit alpha [Patescibacteria group bacterium]